MAYPFVLGEPLTTTQDTPPFFLPLSTAFGYISATGGRAACPRETEG
jgi:hypothetical protein